MEENTEQPLIRGEHEEFKNLNIKPNASDSEDESQQRIFQFSPLSSNKNKIDGEEEGSGSSRNNNSAGENTTSVPTNLLEMRLRDSSSNQHSPSRSNNHIGLGTNSEPYNDLVQHYNEHDSMANNRHSIID